jgi:hypothetical protein
MRWTVSVPVWGNHVKPYIDRVLWRHVLLGLDDCHYIIHTDCWNQINESAAMRRLKRFCEVEFRPLPKDMVGHQRLTACHLDAMRDAEAILFLMPDSIPDVNAFDFVKACKKKMVAVGVLRTHIEPGEEIPLTAAELATWSVDHLHPNWKGLIWGSREGYAMGPTHIYFKSPSGFWMHGFHLHPFSAILTEKEKKCENTIDGDFVSLFSTDDIYVVTDREMALAEISPRSKGEGENNWDISNPSAIANYMRNRANSIHQWFFSHRIMLKGSYDKSSEGIPISILDRLRFG